MGQVMLERRLCQYSMPKIGLVAIYFVNEFLMGSVFRRIVALFLALVTMLTAIACHGSQGSGGGWD